jgi:hypothetical protein
VVGQWFPVDLALIGTSGSPVLCEMSGAGDFVTAAAGR